jgi:hypothetical protein
MQRNKVHHVYTADWVARELGVEEDLVQELAVGMEPEDGIIRVYGLEGDGILAFTDDGVEELRLLLREFNRLMPKT